MNFGSEQVELDGWLLTALEPRSEPLYLANGYLGTSLDWTGGCLPDAPPSPCFLRGVYTDPGDGGVDRLAGIPSWNRLAYSQPVRLTGYRRDLDLYRGALHTQMRLEEERGAVQVHQTVIVSRSDPHLAAIRLTVTPSFSGPIDCRAMLARPVGTGLELQGLGLEGDGTWIRMVARRYGIEVVVRLDFLAADWEPLTSRDEDSIIRGFRREVRAGETVELVQMARVSSSLDEPSHPDRVGVQGAGLNTQTFAAALRAHEEAWASLWTADVEIEGDAEAQQMVRAALFYLWSTVREDDAWSIAPMGLSSLGYNGHIFWDAELWMYPALLATHPNLAKSCLSYREQRLPAARERAASGGYRGARFPWESAFTGDEMTPPWAEPRELQIHITADVALAQWWYYLTTRDTEWLREHGFKVMRECADFWVSRVEWNDAEARYEIRGVQCADEYAVGVDNDAFTNAAARECLLVTTRAAEVLGETAEPAWSRVAALIHIPYDTERRIDLEFDGYDGRVTKQADVELLSYPLTYVMDPGQTARDLEFYSGRVDEAGGPAMSMSVNSILWSWLGRADEAYEYFTRSYRPNVSGPFYAFSETPENASYTFCTGLGGFLQTVIFGFSGLRIGSSEREHDTQLPSHWQRLLLRNVYLGGGRRTIEIEGRMEGHTAAG